jgi:hypothetical protein
MNFKWAVLSLSALALMGCSNDHVAASQSSLGTIQISTVEEFAAIADDPFRNYVLMNDLDFSNKQVMLDCDFSGTLEGNGHSIANLRMNDIKTFQPLGVQLDDYYAWLGLFRAIGEGGSVQNLIFSSCVAQVPSTRESLPLNFGILYGVNQGTVSNCSFSNCQSSYEGGSFRGVNCGIAGGKNDSSGQLVNVTIDESKITETFSDDLPRVCYEGLFAGTNKGLISKVMAHSTYLVGITCGGIVGINFGGTLTQCANISQTITYDRLVSGGAAQTLVGGLAAQNSGKITDSYCYGLKMTGDSLSFGTGDRYVGGLVGTNVQSAVLSRCYFEGSIVDSGSADSTVAGVCAQNYDDIYSCFSDCLIRTPGRASLAAGKEPGNAYRDILSFGVVFKKYSSSQSSPRLSAGSIVAYGGLDYANYVDESTSSFVTTYYFSSSEQKTKAWSDFLVYKGFLTSSNFKVTSFYPTLPGQIGSTFEQALDYQASFVAAQPPSSFDIAA